MKSVCFMKHSNTKSLCYEQYLENDNNYDVCSLYVNRNNMFTYR